jgi:polysaccharide biosynthesis/export protein
MSDRRAPANAIDASSVARRSGSIALPLIGAVHATGLTYEGLEGAVGGALRRGNLVRNPSVAVEIIAYRPIYVLGEVNKPG